LGSSRRKELPFVIFETPGCVVDNLPQARANAMIAKTLVENNVGLIPGEN